MTAVELKSDFKLTTATPHVALMGELWGVCCDDVRKNYLRYNGKSLYLSQSDAVEFVSCKLRIDGIYAS